MENDERNKENYEDLETLMGCSAIVFLINFNFTIQLNQQTLILWAQHNKL
jgi:hypothetical protein